MSRHSTGITIALTVALAVGLSFAPIPDAYRPLPTLNTSPLETVVAAVFPQTKALKRVDSITGAPELATVTPDSDLVPEDDGAALSELLNTPDEPGEALPPAATLGAAEARTVRKLERWAKKVGARHVDIEQSCRVKNEDGTCKEQALDAFFDRLEALQRGEAAEPVRVVHLGDSQIASDHITDVVRRRLELRYGSGGPGFLFVDRPTKFAGRKVRTGEATEGWDIIKLTDKTRDGLLGFSGVRFVSRDGQRTRFNLAQARIADVFYITDPKGGDLDVKADGNAVTRLATRVAERDLAFTRVNLPSGARTLQVDATSGEVNLLGVALETGAPGIVYDTVGLPGALFEVYLRGSEKTFVSQLSRRDPALVVLMLGGNEAYEIGRGWQKVDDARANARKLIARVRKAAPNASCLLISPMDAGIRTVSGDIEPRKHTDEVAKMVREVAAEEGCAHWDLLQAMGGIGSVPRWLELGLFNSDLVHPRAAGADIIGHLFDFALERARSARQDARHARFVEAPGLKDPSGAALEATVEKLKALKESGANGKSVRVVQLGASHTASHMFTDVARAEVAKRFGKAGRGFIAAGRPSTRLHPDVRREIEGDWTFPDAREGGPGEPWGLTGVRAVGQAGAKMRIRFGQSDSGRSGPAELSLYYLETPDMGRVAVRIDGELVAELGPERAQAPNAPQPAQPRTGQTKGRAPPPRDARPPSAPDHAVSALGAYRARVMTWPVNGTSHTIEVHNLGGGPAVIFGASLDQPQGGVVWDALGLPGTTAITADGYDKRVFEEQLRARRADLYVLFFGTNESALPDFDPEAVKRHHLSLLATLRRASPDSECVIMGPTDRLDRQPDGSWKEAPHLEATIRVLREVAHDQGCAFWSARAGMGGPRSMYRWQTVNPRLSMDDGIHLTKEGYEALAQMFVDDLLAVYR